jgi:hypothetical protein
MRQGQSQQNRNRSRGRSHNQNQGSRNKSGNQSNRNLESNGPDVKIRGTASHIAEKYSSLSRDAQSSGDLVAAENYLQHAEHYNRLIAVAQEAQAAQVAQREAARNEEVARRKPSSSDENGGHAPVKTAEASPGQGELAAPKEAIGGSGPQPVFNEMPAEVAIKQPMANGTSEAASADNGEARPAETPRRPRRAARRPRKEAKPAASESKAETKDDISQELPAFIVGAGEG